MSSYYGPLNGVPMTAEKGCNGDHGLGNMFHTKKGVGEFWMASFHAPKYVTMIRILNRNDDAESAKRLAKCSVMIGDEYFGKLPGSTLMGECYEITSHSGKPILG